MADTIGSAPNTSVALPIDSSLTSTIDEVGDTDWFSVSLTAGTTYIFDLQGDTLANPFLELRDKSGALIDIDDDSGPGLNSSIVFRPFSSGIYHLAARASDDNATGTYTLSAQSLPSVSILDATVDEPDSGASAAVFTVSLSSAVGRDVIVTYATSDDLAVVGADYVAATGEVVIPAGSTSATFSVVVAGDMLFEPRETFVVRLSDPINATIEDGLGFGIIEDNDWPPALDLPSDRHFPWQWSLFSQYGVNVVPVWTDYTGKGIRVAVFDQGIDADHPDLDGNLSLTLSRDAASLSGDGLPARSGDNHGTAVAGVIGAERNGDGIVGVAYESDLISIYSPLNESVSVFGARAANAYSYARAAGADIVNDSWGFGNLFLGGANYAFVDNFANPAFFAARRELHSLAAFGRDGLGTVVVQSAGNSYGYGDDTNLHNFQNSRYIITVGASDYFGAAADYSSPGASILVAAPGGARGGASGIVTTDRVGSAGFVSSDYVFLSGTSFSAPIVSGVVALMLEANPGLGYRDVQEILAYTARQVGADPSTWYFNGAGNWNGGGLHFDPAHLFGFGLVDATAAVRLAESWGQAHTLANLQELSFTLSPGAAIPDADPAGVRSSILVTQHVEVERVDVKLDITHPFIGDLSIALESPSGIRSWLLFRPGEGPYSAFGSSQDDIHFTFDTVASWGEDSAGTWTLIIADNEASDSGQLDRWTLTLIGKPASDDDTYVFTNEYAESLAADAARGVLIDAAGIDTLNAAAVTAASTLKLMLGATSTIDGAPLTIRGSTVIEHAIGGDGGDTIIGNIAANWLRGMRGADQLSGGDGDDTLDGGAGDDALDGGGGTDIAVFRGGRLEYAFATKADAGFSIQDTFAGRDGTDTLQAIERLRFSDLSLALDTAGNAGSAYALWNAAFDRLPTLEEMGRWIAPFDDGQGMVEVAQAFIAAYAPDISHQDEVYILYRNVVGIAPGEFEMDYYRGILDRGEMTRPELFVYAAEHELNRADFIDLIAGGISYTPWLA
jgi:subtilisin-like proprotein convertase family protein